MLALKKNRPILWHLYCFKLCFIWDTICHSQTGGGHTPDGMNIVFESKHSWQTSTVYIALWKSVCYITLWNPCCFYICHYTRFASFWISQQSDLYVRLKCDFLYIPLNVTEVVFWTCEKSLWTIFSFHLFPFFLPFTLPLFASVSQIFLPSLFFCKCIFNCLILYDIDPSSIFLRRVSFPLYMSRLKAKVALLCVGKHHTLTTCNWSRGIAPCILKYRHWLEVGGRFHVPAALTSSY